MAAATAQAPRQPRAHAPRPRGAQAVLRRCRPTPRCRRLRADGARRVAALHPLHEAPLVADQARPESAPRSPSPPSSKTTPCSARARTTRSTTFPPSSRPSTTSPTSATPVSARFRRLRERVSSTSGWNCFLGCWVGLVCDRAGCRCQGRQPTGRETVEPVRSAPTVPTQPACRTWWGNLLEWRTARRATAAAVCLRGSAWADGAEYQRSGARRPSRAGSRTSWFGSLHDRPDTFVPRRRVGMDG